MNWRPKNNTRNQQKKSWFFETIHKNDKCLVKLTKRRKQKIQIRDEKGILQQTQMEFR
jgi:hypothetical protein